MNNIPVWHPILLSSFHDLSHEKARWTLSTPTLFHGSDHEKLTPIWAPNGYIIHLEIPYEC